jgi:hypothetical protein
VVFWRDEMTEENLLRATRDVYLLVQKPDLQLSDTNNLWAMSLGGLHETFIKNSVNELRQRQQSKGVPLRGNRTLKTKSLNDAIAVALGAHSYDHWIKQELPRLLQFLVDNDMTRPDDLIRWPHRPGFAEALSAERVACRLFDSGRPLPDRLFTGVGCLLFKPSGYGRLDVQEVAGKDMQEDEERLEYCEKHANEVVLRATNFRDDDGPAFMDLTGRMLALHAVSEYVGGLYNLLGDNLMLPKREGPVFTHYNSDAQTLAHDARICRLFQEEITNSDVGWVDVLSFPGNDQIIFLRGTNGGFDWVIRNQREKKPTSNSLHPMFTAKELPSAMSESRLINHLYFQRGTWPEKIEHDAERHYYEQGGRVGKWPGYEKLIQRELVDRQGYQLPRPPYGPAYHANFVCHRLAQNSLMVSPLVTINDFLAFYESSNWKAVRQQRARDANRRLELDLLAVNCGDRGDLPVSVTWFDAIAYCRDYEERTGLPVRLLDAEDWQQIAPERLQDISRGWGDLTWVVEDGDGARAGESQQRFEEVGGLLRFGADVRWSSNHEGLKFMAVVDFGEWLSDYADGYASAANAATGKALMTGPLERDRCLAGSTMRYKGLKVGFRLCYVARPDS